LCVQEVLDRYLVGALLEINRGVAEDVFSRSSHDLLSVFVAQGIHVIADVGSSLMID
jgi:hypothetical protein